VAHAKFGAIDLYDASLALLRTARVPYPTSPLFVVDSAGESRFRYHRAFYFGCAFSDHHLYGLFSGLAVEGGQIPPEGSQFIHVFDLNGNLEAVYALQRRLMIADVNAQGTTLFAGAADEPVILRVRLPSMPGMRE
jgi:hypothetical protein